MRLAFLGTPDFALPTLNALLDAGHELATVYAQPPARSGRGQVVRDSPVAAFARARGLLLRTPESLESEAEIAAFAALALDAAVVAAFGQILPERLLQAPRLGAFNVHASVLPRWRGAAPIARAIMAGDKESGVSIMRMTAGLDEGPVLEQSRIAFGPLETAGSLHDKLAELGARLMVRTLRDIEAGAARERPQPAEGVTYARKIRPRETRLDFARPAIEVDRRVRGLSPHPGAWFTAPSSRGPARVKALLSQVEAGGGEPGEALDAALLIACCEGAVRLLQVQREGRAPQDAASFLRGFPLPAGTRL
ncbi:MAG TPA: methionyl-tRNA formyltransferase [Caulobacteraceae bacterium]|nr:methionyl-tRNA formyltransferase [Caulobacteraceae bacterium]